MSLSLLIMAAGIGSRYGGLKQLDPVGPNGETLLEYSIYDASCAGFSDFYFVIQPTYHDLFTQKLISRLPPFLKTTCIYQELGTFFPNYMTLPTERKKPWGTAHAVLSAHHIISTPFAVINADDYYGSSPFQQLAAFLKTCNSHEAALITHTLKETLSIYGTVSRGVCLIDQNNFLIAITEHKKIIRQPSSDQILSQELSTVLSPNAIVSLNLWGFHPSIFEMLYQSFLTFLKLNVNDLNAEYFLPTTITHYILANSLKVQVFPSNDPWVGITYPEDLQIAKSQIERQIRLGLYPKNLWENFEQPRSV